MEMFKCEICGGKIIIPACTKCDQKNLEKIKSDIKHVENYIKLHAHKK